jgi:hypothetical protein
MTSGTVAVEPARRPEAIAGDQGRRPVDRGRRRFTVAVLVALVIVGVPFLWVLWDLWTGTFDPLRQFSPSNFYDLQARAMFAGHLYVPNGSLGIEAFVHGGHQYTYFGLFPSILRMPVLLFTHSLDGRLTPISILLAWMVTGLFSALLLWRVRLMIRGDALIGRAEAACCGIVVGALSGGSVLVYLAGYPRVSHEDLAWSVALTIGAAFALLGVLERPSWGRVMVTGAFVLGTNLNRAPTAYACDIAAGLVAVWFALGLGGAESRRWALPTLGAGVVPLAVGCVVNWSKFGMLFGFSEADQVWTQVNAHRRAFLASNGGSSFALKFLPSTLAAYFRPNGLHLQSVFPYITLPTGPASPVGSVVLDQTYPTASIPASMPLLFLLSCWGVVTAFRPHPVGRAGVMRLLLAATAMATAGVLLFGYIADRYLADFLPFLALAGMIGLVDLWRRIDARRVRPGGRARSMGVVLLVAVLVLGLFSVWANLGAAITPSGLWTSSQAMNFVSFQKKVSGGSIESLVRHGPTLPYFAPQGTLFAAGDCSGLYLSTGFSYSTVPGQQLQHETWVPVEQGPGINHVIAVEFNRTVRPSDKPLVLLTYGKSSLVLIPTGTDQVQLAVEDPGAPSVTWPSASAAPVPVQPHTGYEIEAMTDPNLTAIVAGGMGVGIEHYLAGKGPAIVATSPPGSTSAPATVTDVTPAPPSMTLCRSLVRHLDG